MALAGTRATFAPQELAVGLDFGLVACSEVSLGQKQERAPAAADSETG